MLDFLWHLPPTTPPESQFSQFFEAAANAFSLVHALRRHAEEVPQRGDVAFPGRLVDVVASGPEAEGKNQLKNDIQKNDQKLANLGFWTQNFGLFVWQIVKEAFKFSDSSLVCSCGFLVWCHLWCTKCTIGMWRRCMYQTWGKRLY